MSTSDILVLMGPFLVLLAGMIVAFGVAHYNDVKGN
jgi:uncharacterized membrane protein YidH (DUF202 family)